MKKALKIFLLVAAALTLAAVEARAEVSEETVCGQRVIAVYAGESPLEGAYYGEWSTLVPRVGRVATCAALIVKGVGNDLINLSYYWRSETWGGGGQSHDVVGFDGKTFKMGIIQFEVVEGACAIKAHRNGLETTLRKKACP